MTDQNNDTVNFNLEDLTIGEIVTIEELTGLPFDAMTDADKPKGKLLQAIAYISKRRNDKALLEQIKKDETQQRLQERSAKRR